MLHSVSIISKGGSARQDNDSERLGNFIDHVGANLLLLSMLCIALHGRRPELPSQIPLAHSVPRSLLLLRAESFEKEKEQASRTMAGVNPGSKEGWALYVFFPVFEVGFDGCAPALCL
jgi:hypothetical protein